MRALAQAIRQPFLGILAWADHCRLAERLAITYFVYTALLASWHPLPLGKQLIAWSIPLGIWTLAAVETRWSWPWSRVTRDWATLGIILLAYRQVDWFAGAPPLTRWQDWLVGLDRALLDRWGLRAAIESFGSVIPSSLEGIYLCLYLIPPACMGILYFRLRRPEVLRFLTTVMMGTLCAYALLPHIPTLGPRDVFAGADLPHFAGVFRSVNGWLLDRCDITTSVFPSGHVAVAFSCAFGMLRAWPHRRRVWAGAFLVAAMVYTATIYCRYHYAADGLASILISAAAWRVSGVIDAER
jgi:membrane-associated phospholipid phosphatase